MALEKESVKYLHCVKNIKEYFQEYCINTSIHGLKFLGEKGRNLIERLWWFTFISISLYFCISSIFEAYRKWERSPVVVSFSTSETPVWRIPFPAVTICPQVKSQRILVNFTRLLLKKRNRQQFNNKEKRQFEYMSMICKSEWNLINEKNLSETIDGNDINDFFMKVQPSFYDTVHRCYWLGKNCSEDIDYIFTPLITKEGICYSFNLLDRKEIFTKDVDNSFYDRFKIPLQPLSEWSLERGYEIGSSLESFPRRTAVGGVHAGLDLILYLNVSNLDYLCGDAVQGYKVILHNPLQIPYVKQRYFRIGLNQDVTIAVKPNIMTTSKQLEHYYPFRRKCFFNHEKKLRYFKVYDQQNCLHECLSNYTYDHCGCVGFYMLHDNSTPICGPGMQECLEEAASTFLAREINLRMKNHQSRLKYKPKPNEFLKNCNCFPTCNSLTFEAETSQTEWSWKESARALSEQSYMISNKIHFSRLQIFFKDMQFITSERNELYGSMDFLASCGGLLGLFIGFSFISIIEIVYYLTLRLFCNLLKNKKNSSNNNYEPNDKVEL